MQEGERSYLCTVTLASGQKTYCLYIATSPGLASRRARETVTSGTDFVKPQRVIRVDVKLAKYPPEEYLLRGGDLD